MIKKLLVAFVAIAAIAAISYLFITKDKSQEAEFSTYSNDEYGFRFEYPEDWELEDNFKQSKYANLTSPPANPPPKNPHSWVGNAKLYVGIADGPNFNKPEWKMDDVRETTVSGHPAYVSTGNLDVGTSYEIELPGKEGKYLQILTYGDPEIRNPALDHLLKTLVFEK